MAACSQHGSKSDVITTNHIFSVSADSVIEGDFVAYAPSPCEIVLNYRSPQSSTPSWPLVFRLAFNMRDNELLPGHFHIAASPADTIFATACLPDSVEQLAPGEPIAPNTHCTLQVDLTDMTEAFDKHGVWVTAVGDSIFEGELNGVWVIGNIAPL